MLVYHSWEDFVSWAQAPVAISRHSALRGETDSCAFSAHDTLTLSVRVPRVYCAAAANLKLYRDDDMSNHVFKLELVDFLCDSDLYTIELRLCELCLGTNDDMASGLFYYTIELDTPWGLLYTNSNGSVTPDRVNADCTQLLVYRGDYVLPERFRGRMMYQIFPDRFAIGDKAQYSQSSKSKQPEGNAVEYRSERILNTDWDKGVPQYADKPGGDVANNMFFGGDLSSAGPQLVMTLKVATVSLASVAVFSGLEPDRLANGLLWFGCPDTLAFSISFAYRILPVLMEEFQNILLSCRLRGRGPEARGLTGKVRYLCYQVKIIMLAFYPLMLNTAKRSRTTVEALELKGYRYAMKNPAVKKMKLSMLRLGKNDWIFAGISAAWVLAGFFLAKTVV